MYFSKMLFLWMSLEQLIDSPKQSLNSKSS